MKWTSTPEFKVGLLIVFVGIMAVVMSLKVSEDPERLFKTKKVYFILEDAAGIEKNTPIYLAGIRIGAVKKVGLVDGKARVDVAVKKNVHISKSSQVEIRPTGILGDKSIFITPGKPEEELIKEGAQIADVSDKASMDKLIYEIGKIASSISELADNIKNAAKGDDSTSLGRIIKNVENFTGDLAEITAENQQDINGIVQEIRGITSKLDQFVNDDSPTGFQASWDGAMEGLRNIEGTISNFEDISEKINNGEGTIGRLVNDETTVEELNTAISGVNDFLYQSKKIETSLDFHSYYMTGEKEFKSFAGVKIQPGIDRYYLIQVVDDPEGFLNRTKTSTEINGAPSTVVEEAKFSKDRVRFNALFAKNIHDFTFKAGMIENRAGLAIDYNAYGGKLVFSGEAFDYDDLQLRARVKYELFRGVYLIGGIDDALKNRFNTSNPFFGGGLFLTNDDIKALVSGFLF